MTTVWCLRFLNKSLHLRSLGFYHCYPYMSYLKKTTLKQTSNSLSDSSIGLSRQGLGGGLWPLISSYCWWQTYACPLNHHKVDEKKSKIVVTLTSRFVAIDAHQCDNVYLLMSSTAKSYNFPKLSEAWVIFHGSKPEKKNWKWDIKVWWKSYTLFNFG